MVKKDEDGEWTTVLSTWSSCNSDKNSFSGEIQGGKMGSRKEEEQLETANID